MAFTHARVALVTAGLAGLLAGCAGTGGSVGPGGYQNRILTSTNGMTLYVSSRDSFRKSNCTDQCEKNWPPYKASPSDYNSGDFTTMKRDDGSLQWTFEGQPLYFFVKDAKPGDRTGHGIQGAWSVLDEPAMAKQPTGY